MNYNLLKVLRGLLLNGGTNLAIRYNHRISTDIDIFFPHIIGKAGSLKIL
ncbi:nucleotidyl transferase AbiEii/AbiGii toxin family protein [Sphingobacterium alkalisoli]|uniref:Nucleotidyl transferase AbiEii/AbiGii toxin family protein n=2 Tax=Sphingobacterium TaxID=28453 RepID=A0A4V5MKH1_9SPHI|nr:nucleotidyl transferase AbiEii/AbiGii toxin family protein [Sphingobacterium alkalisoli]TJZ53188.1 nucleotidyl transferase AbiEii/AbiGii toxin family protein [Sphingobacterium olei]